MGARKLRLLARLQLKGARTAMRVPLWWLFACRSARPIGETEDEMRRNDRRALGRTRHGAMTCVHHVGLFDK